MEVRITKKAIIMQCGRNRWCSRNRDRRIYRKLYKQEGKEAKSGGQGGEGSLTEETTEVSRERDVQGHAILQITHIPVQILYLTNYNTATFSVNLSI